jgi:hypothetical protein
MNLRICDGERERNGPASIDLVEEAFGAEVREGFEIALADGERWLVAIAVGIRSGAGSEPEFLLSGEAGGGVAPSGRVSRSEALNRFREFVQQGIHA